MDDENDNAQSEIEIIPRFSRDLRNVCTIQAYVASSTSAPANAIYNFSSNCLPTPSGPVRNLTRCREERRETRQKTVAVGARGRLAELARGPCYAACLLAAHPPPPHSFPPTFPHSLVVFGPEVACDGGHSHSRPQLRGRQGRGKVGVDPNGLPLALHLWVD